MTLLRLINNCETLFIVHFFLIFGVYIFRLIYAYFEMRMRYQGKNKDQIFPEN